MTRRQRPGYCKPQASRRNPDKVRWTGLYLFDGKYISAGTYDSFDDADQAWHDQVRALRIGVHADPRKGRTPFRDFTEIFLATATDQKASTAGNYRDTIRSQLIPTFGDLELADITPEHVTRWVRKLRDEGRAAATIRSYKGHLSGVLQHAVTLKYLVINPCVGVRTPKPPPRRIRAITPDDAGRVITALPGAVSRILVELDLQSGCRWGEITELRGRDVKPDPDSRDRVYLDLVRAVSDVGAQNNPLRNGGRFFVEDTTKGGQDRRIGLSVAMTDKLLAYLDGQSIHSDELLFPLSRLTAELDDSQQPTAPAPTPPDDLGRTEPNAAGRTYQHGTITGYSLGRCRCDWCKHAYAVYRANRRAKGKDLKPAKPTKAGKNLTDHLPRDWFRRNFWIPALETAELGDRKIVFHDLRHTHATWLARSHRIDIERLRERMGHRSILTTQQYISAATTIDTTAADIMDGLLASTHL